jgi:methylated-DNA-[protein]-cysteine S-methyltransferase
VVEASPPAEIARGIAAIVALLRGEQTSLADVPLDMGGLPEFHQRVYEFARQIPAGSTCTYGELATRLGSPGAARAVGQAMGRNPFPPVVPCHRVLAAGGKIGGFTAPGGTSTKLRMLAIERAPTQTALPLFAGDMPLAFDPDAALAHLRGVDAKLAALIQAVGPFRMKVNAAQSLFVALMEAIVHQQLTGKAAGTIFGRVCALFPMQSGPTPKKLLACSEAELRSAGLSAAKVRALRDLAERADAHTLPTLTEAQRLADDDVIERLTQVRGIGRWTAEMLLMFRLGRPDILPLDDYGIQKGFALTFKASPATLRAALARRGQRWKPYRTVASWYLWRALELDAATRSIP